MSKNQAVTRIVKGALAASLSVAMAVSALSLAPAATAYAEEAPVKVLDFNSGLRGFKGTMTGMDGTKPIFENGDPNFEIIKSKEVMVKKTAEEIGPSEKMDANNFIYTGDGSQAKYHRTVISNQPATAYNAQKGTVLAIGDTVHLDALVKNVSAGIAIDDVATATLDAAIAIGATAREEYTNKSAFKLTNPLAGKSADAVTVAYWAYVPADVAIETGASVLVFETKTEDAASAVTLYAPAEKAGTWAYYVTVIGKDGATTYVDGVAAEKAAVSATGDYAVAAFTTPETIVFGGTDASTLNTYFGTQVDDVAFYDYALSAEQVTALYDGGAALKKAAVDVNTPDGYYTLNDLAQIEDVSEAKTPVTLVDDTINGKSVKVMKVANNTSTRSKNGFQLKENPMAGKDLEGATVGFWFKQGLNTEGRKPEKTPGAYTTLMILDGEKPVFNCKEEDLSTTAAASYFYVMNNLNAIFQEGSFYSGVGSKIKNTYTFNPDAAKTDDSGKTLTPVADAAQAASADWQYVTVTFTNGGFDLYVNGKKIENQNANTYGPRFSDGYYSHVGDRSDTEKLMGKFGGTNNQMAKMMMDVLCASDAAICFGYRPSSETNFEKSSEQFYANVSVFNAALTEEEVASLYAKETGAAPTPGPTDKPAPAVMYGDANQDGKVDANDALAVLKHVVKISPLTGDGLTAADVDGKAGVDANDALTILKQVVKIITKFPVEK